MNLETLSLKTITDELDFLKKTVIIQWNTRKKIPDPSNAKECYQSYLKKKTQNW